MGQTQPEEAMERNSGGATLEANLTFLSPMTLWLDLEMFICETTCDRNKLDLDLKSESAF